MLLLTSLALSLSSASLRRRCSFSAILIQKMIGGTAATAAARAMAGSALGSKVSAPVVVIASMVASSSIGNARGD